MNTNKINKLKSIFLDSIEITVKSLLANCNYDITRQGRIAAVEENNKYTVVIAGAEYNGISCCCDITLNVNDAVWVTIPQGQWAHKFIVGRR